jgi:hypothetical protein
VARSRLPVAFSTAASRGVAGSGEVDGRHGLISMVHFPQRRLGIWEEVRDAEETTRCCLQLQIRKEEEIT